MPKAFINGVNIHYQQAGTGSDLVLIHGLSGSLAFWQIRIAPELSRNFRVLTYDLRGHGQSDMPPVGYRSSDMAADMVALLDCLQIQQAHLVGHSIGGVAALHMAALHPDRAASLTICDSRIRGLQPSQKLKGWPHWPLWKARLEKRGVILDDEQEMDFLLLDQLMVPIVSQGNEPVAAARSTAQWQAFLANTTAKEDLRGPAGLTDDLISRITAPAHAIYGEYSFCGPTLEGLRRLLPHLNVTVLPKAGHFFPFTQPQVFLSHLEAFLKAFNSSQGEREDRKDTSPAAE